MGEHHWGLPDLVRLLERSAASVAAAHEGAVLVVGDLSRKEGGRIRGHGSHQTGRDADLGFYLRRDGESYLASRYHVIDKDGRATTDGAVRFDDQRNWRLVQALLEDDVAVVQLIFVADHLRKRLLAEGKRQGATKRVLDRAGSVMRQPTRGQRHDDHFHVRIRCPRGQRDCVNVVVSSGRAHGAKKAPPCSAPRKAGAKQKRPAKHRKAAKR